MQFLESLIRYNDRNSTDLADDARLPYPSWLYFRGNILSYIAIGLLRLKMHFLDITYFDFFSLSENDKCAAMKINDTNSQIMDTSCDTENYFICEAGK